MLKFFFTILFLGFILVSLLGFSVIRSFKSFFTGNSKDRNRKRTTVNSNQQRSRSQNTTTQNTPPSRKKVFADDEGEYVDYEEVKD
jgi:hypothetical protein